MIRLSKFNNFLLNTFPEHFCTICLRLEICEIFGRSFCFSRIRGACMVCMTISVSVVSDWLPWAFISLVTLGFHIRLGLQMIYTALFGIHSECSSLTYQIQLSGSGLSFLPPEGGGGRLCIRKSWDARGKL